MVTVSEPTPPFDSHAIIEWAASTLGGIVAPLWELTKRLAGDENEQFAADMRQAMHHGVDLLIRPDAAPEQVEAFQREITAMLDAWVISARLASSAEWHRQVAESDAAVEVGDLSSFGDPLTAEDLHRLSA